MNNAVIKYGDMKAEPGDIILLHTWVNVLCERKVFLPEFEYVLHTCQMYYVHGLCYRQGKLSLNLVLLYDPEFMYTFQH